MAFNPPPCHYPHAVIITKTQVVENFVNFLIYKIRTIEFKNNT